MKAWIADAYGPPADLRLGEIETPALKEGQVLVRLRAASANPFDVKLLAGTFKESIPTKFPHVPGMDAAGIVESVAPGVSAYEPGDAVFGLFRKGGTYAEFAAIAADDARFARKPEKLDFERAAAIPEAAITALTLLRATDVHADQVLLIVGATGGIGLFAIQLARARGARVIATGRADDAGYLRALGAEEVIDYRTHDVLKEVRENYPDGVDAVIDVVNSGEKLLPVADLIRRDGTLASSLAGPPQSAFPEDVNVRYIQTDAHPGDLDDLARRAASGDLRIEIGDPYPFEDAKQSLVDIVAPNHHARGKLVITIP